MVRLLLKEQCDQGMQFAQLFLSRALHKREYLVIIRDNFG